MMRVICLLLVSIFALKVNAQQYTKFNGYGFQADRIKSDSISIHPSDTIRNKAARSIAVLNGVFYIADGTKWKVVGTDTTALSNRINLKLNIADTINKWVTNVYKVDDTTIAVLKNGTISNIGINPSVSRLITSVYNNSGVTIIKGSVVYINGRHSSNLPTIALAQANTEANSYSTFAMVLNDIPTSNSGIVVQAGNIGNLNLPTSSFTDGELVYLSPTVAGGITVTKPLAPNHIVKIGTITRAHPTLGSIELKIENGWQLDELSDVQIASVPLDSTILQFSRIDSLWHDVNPTTAMGNRFVKPTDTATMLNPYSRGSGTSGQVAYWNATRSLTGSSGFTFTPTSSLLLNNSVTAASAIARGQNITSTLTAAANNDVLVGLDVNPTFTNGAFTGVSNVGLRINSGFTYLGGTLRVSGTSTNPSGSGGFFVYDGSEMSNFAYDYGASAYRSLAYNGSVIRFLTSGTERARFSVTNGNLLIGTTTDAGYKLDVNGTARINTLNIGLGGGQISTNTAVGVTALNANTTGVSNTAFGFEALLLNTTSSGNSAFGRKALRATTGSSNVGIGNATLESNTSGSSNVGIGEASLNSNLTGSQNVAIGYQSLLGTKANNNVGIGNTAGSANTTGANNIFIGQGSTGVSATESNRTWIGNSSTITTWLGGSTLIGTTTDIASSKLTVESTTQGFLPPRMTTAQRDLIATPAAGLIIYNTSTNKHQGYNGSTWNDFY